MCLQCFIYTLFTLSCASQIWRYEHDLDMLTTRPLVIAHRGCSGALPEHTAQAYKLAIDEGADFIECDVSLTRDMVAICLHESWMNSTTNVGSVFPNRSNTYWVEDQNAYITDYFSIDFSLDEIKQLGKVQQFDFRDQRFNGQYKVATLQEYITISKSYNQSKSVGIYVEIKDPLFMNTFIYSFEMNGTSAPNFEKLVLSVLEENGYEDSKSNCFIQSFNMNSLLYISNLTKLKLVQLLSYAPDFNYSVLDDIASFAYGVGPDKLFIVTTENRQITNRTDFVAQCHARGLKVHPYTFRNEDRYLAWDYRQDYFEEFLEFFKVNVDGLFTDFAGSYKNFLDAAYEYATPCANVGEISMPKANAFCVALTLFIIWKFQ